VLEQAISEGASVAFISGTQSEMADAVVGNILGQVGNNLRTLCPMLKPSIDRLSRPH